MTCTVFKNEGAWYFLAAIVNMQSCSFQRSIKKFVHFIGPYAYKIVVENKVLYFTMTQRRNKNMTVLHYT